jgi:hypothetical protein
MMASSNEHAPFSLQDRQYVVAGGWDNTVTYDGCPVEAENKWIGEERSHSKVGNGHLRVAKQLEESAKFCTGIVSELSLGMSDQMGSQSP